MPEFRDLRGTYFSSDIDDAMRNFAVLALVALVSGARAADYTVSFVDSFLVQGPAVFTGDRSVLDSPPDLTDGTSEGIVVASTLKSGPSLSFIGFNGTVSRSSYTRLKWRIRPKRELKEQPRYALAVSVRIERADYHRATSFGYVFPGSGSSSINSLALALTEGLSMFFSPVFTQQFAGSSPANVYYSPQTRLWVLYSSGQGYTTNAPARDSQGWYWDLEVDTPFTHGHVASGYQGNMHDVSMESSVAVRLLPISVDNQTLP